jgi:hypothetical protein
MPWLIILQSKKHFIFARFGAVIAMTAGKSAPLTNSSVHPSDSTEAYGLAPSSPTPPGPVKLFCNYNYIVFLFDLLSIVAIIVTTNALPYVFQDIHMHNTCWDHNNYKYFRGLGYSLYATGILVVVSSRLWYFGFSHHYFGLCERLLYAAGVIWFLSISACLIRQ